MEKEEKVAEVVGIAAVSLTVVLLGAVMAFCFDEYRIDRENRKKGVYPPPRPIIQTGEYDRGYREGYRDGRSASFF